jgi:hypothetical protein
MDNINYNVLNYPEKDIDRFWSKVNVIYQEDGTPDFDVCWEWCAAVLTHGYGQFYYNGKLIGAHRFIYKCINGIIPDKICICHKCDNPGCVNPYHLWPGTKIDNNKDMFNKGRNVKGEMKGNTKLTGEQVKQILIDIYNNVYSNIREICIGYNISKSVIIPILDGKNWKHITNQLRVPLEEIKRKIVSKNHKGENNSNSILTNNDIEKILTDIYNNKYNNIQEICEKYNVSERVIRFILNGRTWKHITDKLIVPLEELKKKVIKIQN